MANQPHYWNIDRIMRLIISLAIAAGLILLIRYLSDVLLPFFAACFIAYLLQPLVEFNRRWMHTRGRILAVVVTLLEVGGVLAGLGCLVLPMTFNEINSLGQILHDLGNGTRPVPPIYWQIQQFIDRFFEPGYLQSQVTAPRLEALLTKGSSVIQESISLVLHALEWALMLIYIIFILIDYNQIVRGFKLIIPHQYRAIGLGVVRDMQSSMNHYFRGQGLVALCAAIMYCVGFSIVGLPLAIPMGLLVGILYMIPYFQYVTLIPVAIICLIYSLGGNVTFGAIFGKCLLVYLVSQSTCDYIITPHVMGKEMGLNAAIILLSLSVWGSLLGIIGMIIALPVTAMIMSYYERYISNPHIKTTAPTADDPDSEG